MAERRLKKGLPEFNIPIPESFQNARKNSLASLTSAESQKHSPLRLPHLNWKRFKKKVLNPSIADTVSFKYPSVARATPSIPCTKTKSLSLDFHGAMPITNINHISNGSYRNAGNERPPLQKQKRKSSDTVLELESDDLL
ncbi:unnamed protein product [Nippostrongylus brasiliensis]|uniref:Cylicin_N domain-containing protein n=1 Tax=Nippostrongylus brasiliensis TaxID=27835 RepID=A0A0N4YYR3_NIPBR|nr:unnamed protein product [Nippostrongylus brasiliensis]